MGPGNWVAMPLACNAVLGEVSTVADVIPWPLEWLPGNLIEFEGLASSR